MAEVPSLWVRHMEGLSDLTNGHGGRPKWALRCLVYGVPVVAALAGAIVNWSAKDLANPLLGAFSMLTGVLIGVFTLLASWRTRLDARAPERPSSEAEARRYVAAAAAHSVVAVMACLTGALLSVLVLTNAPGMRLWSPLLYGVSTFVSLVVVLVVRAAYASFELNMDPAVVRADRERLAPGSASE